MSDGEFYAVVDEANRQIARGGVVFQKFTCAACGNRLTMEVPDSFFTSGSCDKCGHVTDIVKQGHGFMLIQSSSPEAKAALNRILDSYPTDPADNP